MKTIKITTNSNCEGRYNERILASGNVSTVIGIKRIVTKALNKYELFQRLSPNYPIIVFVNDQPIASGMAFIGFCDTEHGNNNILKRFVDDPNYYKEWLCED